MPMGLRSAAFVCQRVTNAIVHIRSQMGYWYINYLDDFGSAEPEQLAQKSYDAMEHLLFVLGAPEAKEKSVKPCT